MSGTLYIVATPIGNLADITSRAVEILKKVDLILAEDTRVSKKLLSHYDIPTKIISYHQHSSDSKKLEILSKLIGGESIALVTDAGTPGISDPGNELIDFLVNKNNDIKIIPIPGASSLTAALSVCGFNVSKFLFLGFLPKKGKAKVFDQMEVSGVAIVFFDSPHRILKTLGELSAHFGEDKRVFIGRELTKMHETLYRGNIGEVIDQLGKGKIKGEIVVVLDTLS